MSQSQLIPFAEIREQAVTIQKSRLYGYDSPEQILTLMLVAQSEGRHPASAMKDYHLIKGKPSLKSDAMLARFQQAGGTVRWNERSNEKVSATFAHPQGGEVTVTWTIEDAKRAGLANNDNYRKYARQMLSARCISEGVRLTYPSVISGFYTPEEVADFAITPAPAEKPAISKPLFKSPAPAIEAPAEIEAEVVEEVREDETIAVSAEYNELSSLMAREGLNDADIFAFLKAKKVSHDAEQVSGLRTAIIERLISKFDDVVAFSLKGDN